MVEETEFGRGRDGENGTSFNSETRRHGGLRVSLLGMASVADDGPAVAGPWIDGHAAASAESPSKLLRKKTLRDLRVSESLS